MAKIERTGEAQKKSPTEVYELAVEVFEQEGFEVWKKRPIAWLAMVRKTYDGCLIDGNLAARFTSPTSFTLTLTSDDLAEAELAKAADSFMNALEQKLST